MITTMCDDFFIKVLKQKNNILDIGDHFYPDLNLCILCLFFA